VANPPGQVSKIREEEFKIRSATFLFRGAELQTRTATLRVFILLGFPKSAWKI
jgi:hypothetical protein